jgi:outer membrane protein
MKLKTNQALVAISISMAALCAPVYAGDSPWSLRAGPAQIAFNAAASVNVGGANVAGGNVGVEDNTALAFEIGYALDDRWTARLVFGAPPTTTLSAAGTLKGFVPPLSGTLGKTQYGPAVLSVTYRLGDFGMVQPYVGAGINYTRVFSTTDGDVAGLKIDNAFGTALEAGVDIPLGKSWGLFLDVRKVFVKTSASGSIPGLGGTAAKVDLDLNPLIVHSGVSYRF